MLKKLVAGTLVAGFALTGGLGVASAEEKGNTIKSFDYLKVDEQNVNSLTKLSDQDKKDIQITMVLPEQNENGDWLAYGFTSRETLDAYIEKDKKVLKNKINPLGSGAGSTDFYEHKDKGGQYIYWSSGFKNLPSSWNDRISSVSTASPSASYSTTLWEHTSTQGYGKGVIFKHADWYGKTANLAADWNDITSAIDVKK
ncbi:MULTISPECIES: hypothetical protein [Bacillus]|uniref:hypothetical protein n=1 Tax=Bacillus TaxID=1386 RepID=UPI000B44BC0A|nr:MULTISPECIES: hypothetical protein [Bacillus]MBH0346194.1 hypothetical protein [Bacillus thuringiensis]MDA1904383.1 hypothetical protein [Bacillus cereus]MDA2164516.1 hypothetical protein [Bacillus cereus]MDQ7236464.1 hypothetical protein [Bacillus pacificus]MDQ7237602.1 hypothetical protein [Bacillus pacificus]